MRPFISSGITSAASTATVGKSLPSTRRTPNACQSAKERSDLSQYSSHYQFPCDNANLGGKM